MGGTYEVIKGKPNILDTLVLSIQELIDREPVGFIDLFRFFDDLEHGANDDVRIKNRQIEAGLCFFHEPPGSLLGQLFRGVVGGKNVLVLDSVLGRHLYDNKT